MGEAAQTNERVGSRADCRCVVFVITLLIPRMTMSTAARMEHFSMKIPTINKYSNVHDHDSALFGVWRADSQQPDARQAILLIFGI